jgi:hypothetical protein
VKLYGWPAMTVVDGVPEMVGARFVVPLARTVMSKLGNHVTRFRLHESLTPMMTLRLTPTLLAAGIPVRTPVRQSNEAHDGRACIQKIKRLPSASLATGANV